MMFFIAVLALKWKSVALEVEILKLNDVIASDVIEAAILRLNKISRYCNGRFAANCRQFPRTTLTQGKMK